MLFGGGGGGAISDCCFWAGVCALGVPAGGVRSGMRSIYLSVYTYFVICPETNVHTMSM